MCVAGASVRSAIILMRGVVRLSVPSADRMVTVGVVGHETILGSADILCDAPGATTVDTLTPCELRLIPASRLKRLAYDDPAIGRFLHRLHSERLRKHQLRVAHRFTLSVAARFWLFVEEFVNMSDAAQGAGEVMIPLTQAAIADLLWCTPEHLNRVLSGLERSGRVRRMRQRLVIIDPLQSIAEAFRAIGVPKESVQRL